MPSSLSSALSTALATGRAGRGPAVSGTELDSATAPRWAALVAWGVALGLLFAAATRPVDHVPLWKTFAHALPKGLFWVALFPAVSWWAARLRRLGWGPARTAAAHAPVYVAVCVLDAALRRALMDALLRPPQQTFLATVLTWADSTLALYVGQVLLAQALATRRALTAGARRELRMRAELARARLDHLEAQLRPHFLFNALSTIGELAHAAPQQASGMLRQLGALLRQATDGRSGREIPLREELTTLEAYLAIQRVRFADWLSFSVDVDPRVLDAVVPRLILQPVVENAVRHGLRGRVGPGRITVEASVEDDRVRIRVADNGSGIRRTRTTRAQGGVGLQNVRARLETLYGQEGRLTLREADAGGAVAELSFPFRRAGCEEEELPREQVPEPREPHRPARRPLSPVLLLVSAWGLWGLFLIQKTIALQVVLGRTVQWMEIVSGRLVTALLWMALTPVVLFVAHRLALSRERWLGPLLAHAAAAVAIALSHASLVGSLAGLDGHQWSWAFWYLVRMNLLIYGLLLALGHVRLFERWLRERDLRAARMRSELEAARLRLAMQDVRPDVLLGAIDSMADTVLHDAYASEHRLTRLAEWLRGTLDGIGERTLPVTHELAALDAYLDVRRMTGGRAVRLDVRCDDTARDAEVPPALLRALSDELLEHTPAGDAATLDVSVRDGRVCVAWTGHAIGPTLRGRLSAMGATLEALGRGEHRLTLPYTDGAGVDGDGVRWRDARPIPA